MIVHLNHVPLNQARGPCAVRGHLTRLNAGLYRRAYEGHLLALSQQDKEQQDLLPELKRRAWRATLIARQLVDQGSKEEVSYQEHELANLMLRESRDLPPAYDQLQRKPARDADFLWRCREAAAVRPSRLQNTINAGSSNAGLAGLLMH